MGDDKTVSIGYHRSKDLEDRYPNLEGPAWGTEVVGSNAGDGWIKTKAPVLTLYLPSRMPHRGEVLKKEGENTWRVMAEEGVVFRRTKNIGDKMPDDYPVLHDQVIIGEEDGVWVRTQGALADENEVLPQDDADDPEADELLAFMGGDAPDEPDEVSDAEGIEEPGETLEDDDPMDDD